jgi:hypothetical protein
MEGADLTQDVASIKTAILAKLAAAADLASVKTWLKAEPAPVKYPTSPFGWVEWAGGPRKPEASGMKVVDNFYVVLMKKSANSDANEDAVITLATKGGGGFDGGSQLSGTTFDSYVSNREVQKIPAGDYEIATVRLTIHTCRFAQ